MANAQPIRVAIIGAGTVGSHVVELIKSQAADLKMRIGADLELIGVGVKDISKNRPGIEKNLITDDISGLIDKKPDVLIELMGTIEPARTYILQAIKNGSSVISANKALLAKDGATLHKAAEAAGVDLYYEASVAGAIPLLRPLRESLVGDDVVKILGIVNGTTNYILTKMDELGESFEDALKSAQALGYAETDPTADVMGHDAASKAAILAQLAFHTRVTVDDVYCEGITNISKQDVQAAKQMGFVIKLLAVAEKIDSNSIVVRVHPAMVPRSHPLASVREAFNAVFVQAKAAGSLMFYGRGAGGAPTASAVLGDLVMVGRNRVAKKRGPGESVYADFAIKSIADALTSYYVNLEVADQPGVLAEISSVFAKHEVSIQTVRQDGLGTDANLIIRTHQAKESALASVLNSLRQLSAVKKIDGVMRVEGDESS
jgi:homoserine dehydrogenase